MNIALSHKFDGARKYLIYIRRRRDIKEILDFLARQEKARLQYVNVATLGIFVPEFTEAIVRKAPSLTANDRAILMRKDKLLACAFCIVIRAFD